MLFRGSERFNLPLGHIGYNSLLYELQMNFDIQF